MIDNAKLVRRLYEIASDAHQGFEFQANEILKLGCELFGMELGIISHIHGGDYEVRFVTPSEMNVSVGDKYEVKNTLCDLVVKARQSVALASLSEADWGAHPCYGNLGLRSYIGGLVSDYGTISFSSREPREHLFADNSTNAINLLSVWVSREIERLKRERDLVVTTKKMSTLIKFDSMTGMYSRPSIEGRLKRLLQRSRYTAEPVSAAVIDIDDLKDIDSRYGREVSDEAVACVAQAIDEAVRPTDPSARIGDDEFLVVLVGASERQARVVSERIQEQVAARPVKFGDIDVPVSVSIAVTELSEEIMHIEEILKDTHTRLMKAKKKGKSRIVPR